MNSGSEATSLPEQHRSGAGRSSCPAPGSSLEVVAEHQTVGLGGERRDRQLRRIAGRDGTEHRVRCHGRGGRGESEVERGAPVEPVRTDLGPGDAVGILGRGPVGAGIAVARVGTAAVGALAEKPELFGRLLIFIGLAEGIAIYGLIVSILILNRVGG